MLSMNNSLTLLLLLGAGASLATPFTPITIPFTTPFDYTTNRANVVQAAPPSVLSPNKNQRRDGPTDLNTCKIGFNQVCDELRKEENLMMQLRDMMPVTTRSRCSEQCMAAITAGLNSCGLKGLGHEVNTNPSHG